MLLALKLTITPLAIGLLTLATRRWGAPVGAWLAAIPYTSAPVVAFLAVDRGSRFAMATAVGVLAGTASQAARVRPARWDVALRAGLATAVVVVVTAIAPVVGPSLAGLLSPIPLFGAIFLVFPHRVEGGGAAAAAARGLLWGLFACAGFFAVLAPLMGSAPLALAYLAAATTAAVIQGVTLAVLRRWPGGAAAAATAAAGPMSEPGDADG